MVGRVGDELLDQRPQFGEAGFADLDGGANEAEGALLAGLLGLGGGGDLSPDGLFTGIVALAASLAGHPLGEINPALYAMARRGAADGVERVTSGCNDDEGVRGYCAAPGPWSLPDGIGTVGNAARFVPALAAACSAATPPGNRAGLAGR